MNRVLVKMCAIALAVVAIMGSVPNMKVHAAATSVTTTAGKATLALGEAKIIIRGNEGQSLVGKKFELYKLFDAENATNNESVDYMMNSRYASSLKKVVAAKLGTTKDQVTEYQVIDYMQSMNKHAVEGAQTTQTPEGTYSNYRYFVEEVMEQIKEDSITADVEVSVADTKYDNSIEIAGLTYGYYMIEDTSDSKGADMAVSMLMLNTANPELNMNIKADYPTITKKIQEDDNQDTIGNTGWNDYGDYEIGQDIPFRYDSIIPNINGYHEYYFAMHDRMDEALTLQKDSIKVTLYGKIGSVNKGYRLLETEYNLLENTGDATFVIEIENIKSIIDREFNNKNSDGENIYGQEVVVTYTANLNDKAAKDTGRPGFENDVRLEFSNNPNFDGAGETGLTPWDTVVCFTYQLDGLKVNNYGTKLEGAVFRIYTDEACKNEVCVKQGTDGYIVMSKDIWTEKYPSNAVGITSNANGEFIVYGLDSGTYYLKEESAPAGYRPILDPIKLEITSKFPADRNSYTKGAGINAETLTLSAKAHIKTYVNGKYNEKNVTLESDSVKGSVNLSVVNEIGKKLPVTGSFFMPVLTAAGVVCMLAAVRKGRMKHE